MRPAVTGLTHKNRWDFHVKLITKQAGLKGFEPLTYRLRVCRSTELSYKPAK
jgi:hypothetical protein